MCDQPLSLHLENELLARESQGGVPCALVRVRWVVSAEELSGLPGTPLRDMWTRNFRESWGPRLADGNTRWEARSRLDPELLEYSFGWRPVHKLPLKMHRLLAIGVVAEVSKCAAIDVRA